LRNNNTKAGRKGREVLIEDANNHYILEEIDHLKDLIKKEKSIINLVLSQAVKHPRAAVCMLLMKPWHEDHRATLFQRRKAVLHPEVASWWVVP
jgi:hypothetical protein